MLSIEMLRDQFIESMQKKGYVSLLTGFILFNPIRISGSSDYVEKEFIAQCIRENGKNPFTNERMTMEALLNIPTEMDVVAAINDAIETFLFENKKHANLFALRYAIREEQFQPNSLLGVPLKKHHITGPVEPTPDDLLAMYQAMGVDAVDIHFANPNINPAALFADRVQVLANGSLQGLGELVRDYPEHSAFFYAKVIELSFDTLHFMKTLINLITIFPRNKRSLYEMLINDSENFRQKFNTSDSFLKKLITIFPEYRAETLEAIKRMIRNSVFERSSRIHPSWREEVATLFPDEIKAFIEITITDEHITQLIKNKEVSELAQLIILFPERAEYFLGMILSSKKVKGEEKTNLIRELISELKSSYFFRVSEQSQPIIARLVRFVEATNRYDTNIKYGSLNAFETLAYLVNHHPEDKNIFYQRFFETYHDKYFTKILPKLIKLIPKDKELFYSLITDKMLVKIITKNNLNKLIDLYPHHKSDIFERAKKVCRLEETGQPYSMHHIQFLQEFLLAHFPQEVSAMLETIITHRFIADLTSGRMPSPWHHGKAYDFCESFPLLAEVFSEKRILTMVSTNALLDEETKVKTLTETLHCFPQKTTNEIYEYAKNNNQLSRMFNTNRTYRSLPHLSPDNLLDFYEKVITDSDLSATVMSGDDCRERFVSLFPGKEDEIYEKAFKPHAVDILNKYNRDRVITLFPKYKEAIVADAGQAEQQKEEHSTVFFGLNFLLFKRRDDGKEPENVDYAPRLTPQSPL